MEGEEYSVPAWMGLPDDTDKSGKIRPEIVYYDENEKPDLGLILEQDSILKEIINIFRKERIQTISSTTFTPVKL